MLDGHLVEHFPWSALGRREQAKVVLSDQGGVWISFLRDGGVSFFKDRQVRASYTAANGLGKGNVPGLQLDRDGALWAATEEGGLSRIKDGRIATLTSRNGLPCDTIHFTTEDDDRSFWLYTACGLVRIARNEMDAWIADPKRRVETAVWGAADGVRRRPFSPDSYGPAVAKLTDGKLWFLTGEGVQVVDPRHLVLNKLPPPVHIEQVVADHQIYWQNLLGAAVSNVRLPPRTQDLQIDYTALSLVAPEKVRFRYKLEGWDRDWQDVGTRRQAFYNNLPPRNYRFRVIACNNSGVWNEAGTFLDFAVAPAYYQTNWFRALCAAIFLALLWAAYQFRVHQLQRESKKLQDVIDTIPGNVWSALPDGSVDFINRLWLEFSGVSSGKELGRGWEAAVHPDDVGRFVDEWRAAVASGKAWKVKRACAGRTGNIGGC
jgi:PAS domain-containing protein